MNLKHVVDVKYVAPVLYVLTVLLANLTAMVFIELPAFGITTLGTLFFGAVFTLRDYVHKNGKPFVYKMIAVAAFVNFTVAFALGEPLRIVLASFISILVSEAVDTEVYQAFIKRSWTFRVLSSNAVSIPVDTLLFTSIAFAGVLSWTDFNALLYGDSIVKFTIATLVGLMRLGMPKFIKAQI